MESFYLYQYQSHTPNHWEKIGTNEIQRERDTLWYSVPTSIYHASITTPHDVTSS